MKYVAGYYQPTVNVKTVVKRKYLRRNLRTIQPIEPYATLIGTGDISIKARSKMKRGVVERDIDVSGVTGTGQVSTFVVNDDGRVVIFWPVGEGVWPSLEEAKKVHGHGGKTRFVILDDDEVSHCVKCHSAAVCEHEECPGCLSTV